MNLCIISHKDQIQLDSNFQSKSNIDFNFSIVGG